MAKFFYNIPVLVFRNAVTKKREQLIIHLRGFQNLCRVRRAYLHVLTTETTRNSKRTALIIIELRFSGEPVADLPFYSRKIILLLHQDLLKFDGVTAGP